MQSVDVHTRPVAPPRPRRAILRDCDLTTYDRTVEESRPPEADVWSAVHRWNLPRPPGTSRDLPSTADDRPSGYSKT
jgi:hypothetical protein